MPRKRLPVTVLCCLLLVVAGCQGGTSPSQTTTATADGTPTPEATQVQSTTTQSTTPDTTTEIVRDIEVEGGSLPYDANTVWQRVETMLDVDVGAPVTVELANLSGVLSTDVPRFEALLGVPAPEDEFRASGITTWAGDGNVVKLSEHAREIDGGLEGTLAHEYVHVVQMRQRMPTRMEDRLGSDPSVDRSAVFLSVLEGSATYVENRYRRQYLPNASEDIEARYRDATSTAKRTYGPYYFGARYVNDTVESPVDVDSVYENPPQTTEELIHGLEPGSEQPASLSVTAESDRETTMIGPYGELYVRTLFGTALNESAVSRLADGWGNDTRIRFGTGADSEFAWVLRWDDAANATEFEAGVDAYLDARETNGSVRLSRVAPETTVVFVGSESFVANADASGENGTVTVEDGNRG